MTSPRLRPWPDLAVLGAILLLFAARNLPWRLSDYDQAKQAFTSLEMVEGGRWAFQHLPGTDRPATKPPLIGWAAAILRVFPGLGNWEAAWRLPSAVSAALVIALLWRAGGTVWPAGGAALAVGAFGLNILAPRVATLVRTDMPLTLLITVLGLLVWQRLRAGDGSPWTPRERWAVFALVTAAMLTKGPVVYAFLLPGLAAHFLWERRLRRIAPLQPSTFNLQPFPLWPWFTPLAVFAVWLLAGCWTQPGFYEEVVGREFLGRFDVSERPVHNPQPVWFYAIQLLGRWGPWSWLLLGLAFGARGAWRAALREDAGARWLLCWAVGGLVFMSLVPSKRVDRIFPVIPPLCLLLATVAGRHMAGGRPGVMLPGAAAGENDRFARAAHLAVRWALPVALVVSIASTSYEVRKSFRRHESALENFGRRVRQLTATHGWAPAELVVSERKALADEPLLVALRRLRWLRADEASEAWSAGRLDTLVLEAGTLEAMRAHLEPFRVEAESRAPARHGKSSTGKPPRYLLIRREGSPRGVAG